MHVCKKIPVFQLFHLNLNGLSTIKFKVMLYRLHFKSPQMFCFKYLDTIHLTCTTHKKSGLVVGFFFFQLRRLYI